MKKYFSIFSSVILNLLNFILEIYNKKLIDKIGYKTQSASDSEPVDEVSLSTDLDPIVVIVEESQPTQSCEHWVTGVINKIVSHQWWKCMSLKRSIKFDFIELHSIEKLTRVVKMHRLSCTMSPWSSNVDESGN